MESELLNRRGVVDTPPGIRISSAGGPGGDSGFLSEAPVVDRLLRLYAYCVRYIESVGLHTERYRWGGYLNASSLYRGIKHQAEHHPGIFHAFLEYPQAFEDAEPEPLEHFLWKMPASVSVWDMDRAVERLTGVEFPPLLGVSSAPRRRWRTLELPGSMGHYTSLLCRAYPELDPHRNCTMITNEPFSSATGALESAVTNVNALLARGNSVADPVHTASSTSSMSYTYQEKSGGRGVAGGSDPEGSRMDGMDKVVRSYDPSILDEAYDPDGFREGFDLIVGSREDVRTEPGQEGEKGVKGEESEEGRATLDTEALRQSLAPGGDLVLLDVPPVRLSQRR
jgi:hypothetical protein